MLFDWSHFYLLLLLLLLSLCLYVLFLDIIIKFSLKYLYKMLANSDTIHSFFSAANFGNLVVVQMVPVFRMATKSILNFIPPSNRYRCDSDSISLTSFMKWFFLLYFWFLHSVWDYNQIFMHFSSLASTSSCGFS